LPIPANNSLSARELQCAVNNSQGLQARLAQQRISSSGVLYIRDQSNPSLGEAFRDPKGLIWGEVLRDSNGDFLKMKILEARAECNRRKARLPWAKEVNLLFNDMASSTSKQTNPFIGDGVTFLVPDLLQRDFWTTTALISEPGDRPYSWWVYYSLYSFLPNRRDPYFYQMDNKAETLVRCVSGPESI